MVRGRENTNHWNHQKKYTWLILVIATAFLLISAVGPVEAAGSDKTGLSGKRPSVQTYTPTDDKWGTSEELFSGYVDREMMTGGENADPGKTEDSSNQPGSISAKNDTGSRLLTGGNRAVYQALRTLIAETAAGKRESTEYEIGVDFADFGLENKRFTAKDLGVTSLTEAGTSISDEANEAMLDKLNFDLDKVITALLVDCPYDLYWYDKTRSDDSEGTSAWMQAYYSVRKDNKTESICFDSTKKIQFTLTFPVAEEYAAPSGESYKVDTSIGQAVEKAASNAARIVAEYKDASDYDKLDGYREEICDLVSYHDQAASEDLAYGNPWQLIWVFDGDPDTHVVCEGYSKAFQHLCDQSEFEPGVSCITVEGKMVVGSHAEAHMWNVVAMDVEDGKSYLVDVTNCDEGTIGEERLLFLAGAKSGSVMDGYLLDCGNTTIRYYYDQKNAINYYTEKELSLAESSYQPAPVRVCAVTFHTNGLGTTPEHQSIKTGGKATRPSPDPVAEGYRFTGWYQDQACTTAYDFDSEVHDNIYLFAGWKEKDSQSNFCFAMDGMINDEVTNEKMMTRTYGDPAFDLLTSGAESGSSLTYSSSNEAVARIGSKGEVEILAAGETWLHAVSSETEDYAKTDIDCRLIVGSAPINKDNLTITIPEQTYSGKPLRPAIQVKYTRGDGGFSASLKAGEDYSIEYRNNTAAFYEGGSAARPVVKITGKKNYFGSVEAYFVILPKEVKNPEIILSTNSFVYDGEAKEPKVTVKDGETTVPENEYRLEYSDNQEIGTGIVKVIDQEGGNYIINGSKEFAITDKLSLAAARITGLSDKTRTGKAICPTVKVVVDEKLLAPGTDYQVTYHNNVNVGTASVKITGTGMYTDTLTRTFRIIPKKVKAFKLKRGKKAFKVKWTRQKDQTTGYQIQYSLKAKFKPAKIKTVKKNKTTSLTIKKLKKKKKYYVRIRTYKKIGKSVYYSSWSKVRAIKTK